MEGDGAGGEAEVISITIYTYLVSKYLYYLGTTTSSPSYPDCTCCSTQTTDTSPGPSGTLAAILGLLNILTLYSIYVGKINVDSDISYKYCTDFYYLGQIVAFKEHKKSYFNLFLLSLFVKR